MVSAWIQHIKKVQKEKGLSYKEAMSVAAESYKSSPETGTKKHHKKHKKGHTKKHHKRRRHHRGGDQNADAPLEDAAPVKAETTAEIGGTAAEGASCTLPARDGSGSVTTADLAACNKKGGGRRRKTRKRRRKGKKKRGKTRKSRRRRRRRRR